LSSSSATSSAGCHTKNGGLQLLPPPLSIRVAEHWEYSVGGGLVDPHHYDVDSVLTIVALLSDESTFEGGTFRTLEADDSQLEHPMAQGDVICFVSHKYHNVVPVTEGKRCSFVMELWQGGLGHIGR
jgi:predicted 2-oxoglutarate/Fe(II)-dependent dioxygenase YbiX